MENIADNPTSQASMAPLDCTKTAHLIALSAAERASALKSLGMQHQLKVSLAFVVILFPLPAKRRMMTHQACGKARPNLALGRPIRPTKAHRHVFGQPCASLAAVGRKKSTAFPPTV